jgi:uncharacterized protein (DUF885 family)
MERRAFLTRTAQVAAGFGILRYATACRSAPTADPQFAALQRRYFIRSLELNPVTSTYLGGDGFAASLADVNGRLRDYGAPALAAEAAFLREIRTALAGFDPARLATADRIDHGVMGAQIDYLLHQIEERHYQQRCLDSYVAEPFRGVDWQIQQMTDASSGLLGSEPEWALVVARVRAIPAYLDTARANLLAGKTAGNVPDRRMIAREGIAGSAANAAYFRATLSETAGRFIGNRPFAGTLRSELDEAGGVAATACSAFAAFLQQTFDAGETVDRFAAGETEYAWRLSHCLQERRTPAELWEYGAAQVAVYETQIYRVAEEVARAANLRLAFDTPDARRAAVRAVMDHLSADAPRDDDDLFRWYREAGERAVEYGRAHDLFDIPAEYRLDVVATPPVLRSTIDAAYYPAPPFKSTGVGRFYLTPTGNDPAALKLNNRASVADTAVHEGFPGHDWNYKFMTQHAAEISNVRWLTPGAVEDSSSMWEDSMASEGWALYAEELMAEPGPGRPHGFYSPDEHLYELQGQLLRAVRVRVDVGIHTGRLTFDEAVDYYTAHVEFYPGARAAAARDPRARAITDGATRALYRYSKWPTQAITYNLGKNAIVELRAAVKAKQGAGFSAKRFHERFMAMGSIPPAFFRDALLNG